MPDEPTTEMLKFIDTWRSACAGWKDIKSGTLEIPESECMKCPDRMKCIAANKAIRRRIERKVSREWVGKWAKKLSDLSVYNDELEVLSKSLSVSESMDILIAMLKELGVELNNAE